MALLVFTDGRRKIVSAEAGADLWRVLNGEVDPTPAQETFCLQVDAVYLSWRTAPDSYVQMHLDTIASNIVSHWMVRAHKNEHKATIIDGTPTRPDPSDQEMIAFCEKWGLTVSGITTSLAKQYFPIWR